MIFIGFYSANVCLITQKGHFSSHDYVTLRTYFWAKTKSPKLFCSARNACVMISSFSHIHLSNLLLWELEKRVGFNENNNNGFSTEGLILRFYVRSFDTKSISYGKKHSSPF